MARINLDQLSNRRQFDKTAARKSLQWFESQVKYLGDAVSPNSLMSNGKRRQDYIIPGQMYLYFYHPVGIDTLPYYDTFPLVLPFSEDATTFTGLNFHYLPVKLRVMLLNKLMDFATDKKVDEKTRLRFQWQFVKGISRYQGVESAVKKYRKDHVASQFLFVPATQWFNAVMLPVERFNVGASMSYFDKKIVWRDSLGYQ